MEEDACTRRNALEDLPKVAKHILAMKDWSKEDIESALSNRQYKKLEIDLVQNLASATIARAPVLSTKSAAWLSSIFLAHYVVNIAAANDAAKTASWKAARDAAGHVAASAAADAAKEDSMDAAMDASRKATRDAARNAAWDAAGYAAWQASSDAAEIVTSAVLTKLALDDLKKIGEASWKLANLYVLAYVALDKFQKDYFLAAYHAVFNNLESDPAFKLSQEDVINVIASNTWLKDELANNPHTASQKRIVETITR